MSTATRPTAHTGVTAGLAVLIVSVLATATATALVHPGGATDRPPGLTARDLPVEASPDAARALAATPERVRIPAIGVDTAMVGLGLNDDGTLQVPNFEQAGWYRGGPKPGEIGPAVIAAHVDSTTGPAVFFRLHDLAPGDTVTVDYDDGTAVDFVVRGSGNYLKTEFPTQLVYGDTGGPELRLITCGGSFDRRAGNYDENLVVWAAATDQVET